MAKSINQAFKKIKSDELYTPSVLVAPIIPHVTKWASRFKARHNRIPIVLMPFDTGKSEFVKMFSDHSGGNGDPLWSVKFGHIDTGQDFFIYDYGDWDICISNPPFSKKLSVFETLDSTGKPYAMVMNCMALNYHQIINHFCGREPQILFFNKRVSYDGGGSTFGSCYVCRDFLPKQILCEPLPHNNTGRHFVPSGMFGTK